MEFIWRLLVAIFLICIGTMLLLVAFIYKGTGLATFCVYAFFILVVIGVIKGILVIVDHDIDAKHKENE